MRPLTTLVVVGVWLGAAQTGCSDPDGDPVPGEQSWAVAAGGTGYNYGRDVAVDSSGNSTVTGNFAITLDVGEVSLSSSGDSDIFVARVSPQGKPLWAISAGDSDADSAWSVAVDGSGNSYTTGYFSGSVSFGTATLSSRGAADIFVAKVSPGGAVLWAISAGGSDTDYGKSIAVDSAGNSYVAANFNKTASFGTTTLTSAGKIDIAVAKVSPGGQFLWAVSAGDTDTDFASGVALDSAGAVHVTGSVAGKVSFGATTITSMGIYYPDIFVAKMNPNGKWLWATRAGGTAPDYGQSIAIDGVGNSHVAGTFQSFATFGSTSITARGQVDLFVSRLDTDGKFLWTVAAGGPKNDLVESIAVDSASSSTLTGSFQAEAIFGTKKMTSKGKADVFVARIDHSGSFQWVTSAGSDGDDQGWGVALDIAGRSHVTGHFEGDTKFGTALLSSKGRSDIFVWKLE